MTKMCKNYEILLIFDLRYCTIVIVKEDMYGNEGKATAGKNQDITWNFQRIRKNVYIPGAVIIDFSGCMQYNEPEPEQSRQRCGMLTKNGRQRLQCGRRRFCQI